MTVPFVPVTFFPSAAREAAIRTEIETLTRQLVDLAERLRQLEQNRLRARSSPVGASSSPIRAARGLEAAGLDFSFAQPEDAPKDDAVAVDDLRAEVGVDDLRAEVGVDDLRAEAKATLRRLEELSPVMADNCRKAFAELDND